MIPDLRERFQSPWWKVAGFLLLMAASFWLIGLHVLGPCYQLTPEQRRAMTAQCGPYE